MEPKTFLKRMILAGGLALGISGLSLRASVGMIGQTGVTLAMAYASTPTLHTATEKHTLGGRLLLLGRPFPYHSPAADGTGAAPNSLVAVALRRATIRSAGALTRRTDSWDSRPAAPFLGRSVHGGPIISYGRPMARH